MGAVTVGYLVGWRELASYHELYYDVALLLRTELFRILRTELSLCFLFMLPMHAL